MEFSGKNRKQNLENLKFEYDGLAAEAQRLDKSGIKNPQLKIGFINGEPGTGKSRLVLELFNRLVDEEPLTTYWNKLNNFDTSNIRPIIQLNQNYNKYSSNFIWWTLDIAESKTRTDTIFSNLNYLIHNLTLAKLALDTNTNNIQKLKELANLGIDLGLSLTEDFVGWGTVKRLSESVLKIGNINKDKNRISPESIIDNLIQDLSELFNPDSRFYSGQTLIIFIDDGQFANNDPILGKFIDKLIYVSQSEKWPLLILITHWSRELNSWIDNEGIKHAKSIIKKLIEFHTKTNTVEINPTESEICSAKIEDYQIFNISLNEPVDDLKPALLSQFPKLQDEVVNQVLSMAGGNPRKLEQLISKMKNKPVWFESFDQRQTMTKVGLKELSQLSGLTVDEIALDRYKDMPLEVKGVISLAGLIGPTFVISLIEDLASEIKCVGYKNVRNNLRKGDEEFYILSDVSNRMFDDIAKFREPLFHNASLGYINDGHVNKEIKGWPSNKQVNESIKKVLYKFLLDINDKPHLSESDIVQCLKSACYHLNGQDHLKGAALAFLVDSEDKRNNFEGALQAAKEFYYLYSTNPSINEVLNEYILDKVSEILRRYGNNDQALELLKVIHSKILNKNRSELHDDKVLHDLSVSYERLGDCENDLSNIPDALIMYQSSAEILKKLTNNLKYKSQEAGINIKIAYCYYQENEFIKAKFFGEIALEIFILIEAREPSYQDHINNKVNLFNLLSDIENDLGEVNKALAYLEEGQKLLEKNANKQTLNLLRYMYFGRKGSIYQNTKNYKLAIECFDYAYNYIEIAIKKDPKNTTYLEYLAQVYMNLGKSNLYLKNYELAGDFFVKSLNILETITNNHNAKKSHQRQLANLHEKIGLLNKALKQTNIARKHLNISLEIYNTLLKHNPNNPLWLGNKQTVLANMAMVESDDGNIDVARLFYEQAILIAEEIYKQNPKNISSLNNLTFIHFGLADIEAKNMELSYATKTYLKIIKLIEESSNIIDENPQLLLRIALSYDRLSKICIRENKFPSALKYSKLSVKNHRQVVSYTPNDAEQLINLSIALATHSEVYLLLKKIIEAEINLRESIKILGKLYKVSKSDNSLKTLLSERFIIKGDIELAKNHKYKSEKFYNKAIKCLINEIDSNTVNPSLLHVLINANLKMAEIKQDTKPYYKEALYKINLIIDSGIDSVQDRSLKSFIEEKLS